MRFGGICGITGVFDGMPWNISSFEVEPGKELGKWDVA
jgi:hypothetical protein